MTLSHPFSTPATLFSRPTHAGLASVTTFAVCKRDRIMSRMSSISYVHLRSVGWRGRGHWTGRMCCLLWEEEEEEEGNCGRVAAPGSTMSYDMLHHISSSAERRLLEVLNWSWRTGEVPASWRAAEIVAIPKKGKPHTETGSYRPISLLEPAHQTTSHAHCLSEIMRTFKAKNNNIQLEPSSIGRTLDRQSKGSGFGSPECHIYLV